MEKVGSVSSLSGATDERCGYCVWVMKNFHIRDILQWTIKKKPLPKLSRNDLGKSFRLLKSTKNLNSGTQWPPCGAPISKSTSKLHVYWYFPPKHTSAQGAIRTYGTHDTCWEREIHSLLLVCLKVILFEFTHTHTHTHWTKQNSQWTRWNSATWPKTLFTVA